MRHALAIAGTALVVTAACVRDYPDPKTQPNPGTGYSVAITGAQVVGRDNPYGSDDSRELMDAVARRLAAEMCDREARCHAVTRTAEECWNANLEQARLEVGAWRCSPAAMRARVEKCLSSIGAEPCDHVLGARGVMCARNVACEADAPAQTEPQ
jgi:hypothetical protein